MKEILSSLGSPVVLCHNDLLCKNIIYNEKQGRCLTLAVSKLIDCILLMVPCLCISKQELKHTQRFSLEGIKIIVIAIRDMYVWIKCL